MASFEEDKKRAVQILNEAKQCLDSSEKLKLLGQLVELILRKNSKLLQDFVGHFFEFQLDNNSKIRKYVALSLAEIMTCLPPGRIAECGQCLIRLLKDNAGQVAKHALISATSFVQLSFPLVCGIKYNSSLRLNEEESRTTWSAICAIREHVSVVLASKNLTGQTLIHAVKFIEALFKLVFPPPEDKKMSSVFDVSNFVQGPHPLINIKEVQREADVNLSKILSFLSKFDPSEVASNSTTAESNRIPLSLVLVSVGSVTAIASYRYVLLGKIVPKLLSLAGCVQKLAERTNSAQLGSLKHAIKVSLLSLVRERNDAANTWRDELLNTLRKLGYGADGDSAARAVERAAKRERELKAKEESEQKNSSGKRQQPEPAKEESNKRIRKDADQLVKEAHEPDAIELAKNKIIHAILSLAAAGPQMQSQLNLVLDQVPGYILAEIVMKNLDNDPIGGWGVAMHAEPSSKLSSILNNFQTDGPGPSPERQPDAASVDLAKTAVTCSPNQTWTPPSEQAQELTSQDEQGDAAMPPAMPSSTATISEYGASFPGQIPGIGQASSVNGFIPGIGMAAAQPSHTPFAQESREASFNKDKSMEANDIELTDKAKSGIPTFAEHPDKGKIQKGIVETEVAVKEEDEADNNVKSLAADEMLDAENPKTRSAVTEIQITTPSMALTRLPIQSVPKDTLRKLQLDSLERILYSKDGCRNSGRRALRIRQEIIARKVFEVDIDEEERPIAERSFFKKLVSVIVEDHSAYQGFELAIALCKQAFIRCSERTATAAPSATNFERDVDDLPSLSVGGDTGEQPRIQPRQQFDDYTDVVISIISEIATKLPPRLKLVPALLETLPSIPDKVLALIKEICLGKGPVADCDPTLLSEWSTIGLSTLRTCIVDRAAIWKQALDECLHVAVCQENEIRSKAIRLVVNKLFPDEKLKGSIRSFAIANVEDLRREPSDEKCDAAGGLQEISTDRKNGRPPELSNCQAASHSRVECALSLFIALCTREPSLLQKLSQNFPAFSPAIQEVVLKVPTLKDLARTLTQHCPELLSTFRDLPQAAEPLMIVLLNVITENEPPNAELSNVVRKIYERKEDVRLLVPIIPVLKSSELQEILPKFVDGPIELFKQATAKTLQYGIMEPREILVTLHDIPVARGKDTASEDESKRLPLKKIAKAVEACLSQKSIFTPQIFAAALQILAQRTPIPLLLMRTLLQALQIHPTLSKFATDILRELVQRQVWNQPSIWLGFLMAIKQLAPQSIPIILELPLDVLSGAISKLEEIKGLITKYVVQNSEKVPQAVADVILK